MEGTVVNQIEIKGFSDDKKSEKFRKQIKSLRSVFHLSQMDKNLDFAAADASWKKKDDHSLVYLFLTEGFSPESEICSLAELYPHLEIHHMIISPNGKGLLLYFRYSGGKLSEKTEQTGSVVHMLGDLIKGGFL
ncbi:MAG: hypothetical protein JEY91_00260 [Spirochaetaceae bacterium]|nr:hypothetical protein [Spirochaetaceae bacterium]